MAKNNHKLSLFDRAMRLADRYFDGISKFKRIAAKAEKENVDFLDQKIPVYRDSFERSMYSASQLGSRLEAKTERIIFGKDLYLGADGEAHKREAENNSASQDDSSAILNDQNALSTDVDGLNETPAVDLPAGWKWIDYDDGSGHLASPEGKSYFSYDLAPYCSSGGIEFKAYDDSGWDVFEGSLSAFKANAEMVVTNDHLYEKPVVDKEPPKTTIDNSQTHIKDAPSPQSVLVLGDYDIAAIMLKVSSNAWYGSGPTKVLIAAGENTIEISGYVYEPIYEDFSATSSISLNGSILYGMDSRNVAPYRNETYHIGVYQKPEDAISHIKDVCIGKHFVMLDDKEVPIDTKIKCASHRAAEYNPHSVFRVNGGNHER